MSTKRCVTAVIGAGASGCMAAVSSAMRGDHVVLLESGDRIGRKIYATGNGRCNLTNLRMSGAYYHCGGEADLSAFFARFDERDLMDFWRSRGIYLHDRKGYVYPRTDQAATIAEGFAKILKEYGVDVRTGAGAQAVKKTADGVFEIDTPSGRFTADRVILACGGLAGPQYGCSGDGYRFARQFGHSLREPLPALVPLLSEGNRALKAAAGVRCDARITLTAGGREVGAERGELQMTDKGISGIPVFQLSGTAARALARGESVAAVIDFLPEFDEESWQQEMDRRLGEDRDRMLSSFFLGLVNKKVLDLILLELGLQAEKKASKLSDEALLEILEKMRAYEVPVTGTGAFSQAQVTSGGVPLSELDEDLGSKLCPGLYMAGEMLDVDGICGGYNLQWAMTSGWIAGGMKRPDRAGISYSADFGSAHL